MAVVVDDKVYPLHQSNLTSLLYTGDAPTPSEGYYFAKTSDGNHVTEREPFTRNLDGRPGDDIYYEVYNRSVNVHQMKDMPQYLDPLDSIHRVDSDLHRYNEIATVHFTTANQSAIDYMHTNVTADFQVVCNMTYIRGDEIQTFDDVELELAGRSSRTVPKLSYNIKIPKGQKLYEYRRLKLRSLFSDPSYLRESMAYRIIESTGLVSSKFSYIRVFINNETAGLFGIIENFKNPWAKNEFANGDNDYPGYSRGNLYQGHLGEPPKTFSDLGYIGDNVTAYAAGQYKIKEDPSEGEPDYAPLMNLTRFIAHAPINGSNAVEEWNKHLEMESVLRSMALEVLVGYSDGYLTLADNYYVYQMGVNSSRFLFIPSDLDLTFGSTLVKMSDMLSGDYNRFPGLHDRPLTSQFLRVPEFKDRFEELLKNLSADLVTPKVLDPVIDDTVNMIRPDVEWDLTLPRLSKFNISNSQEAMQSLMDMGTESANQFSMPSTIDNATVQELFTGATANVTFDQAISGHLGFLSLASIKEFIANQSTATQKYYQQHQ
ncbi:coth-domain-containing protein [Lichtheimia hyalospora FSU 10163]|nr:coth-domain-containing protein [Lichtheimia hyalospora FSU 10163]